MNNKKTGIKSIFADLSIAIVSIFVAVFQISTPVFAHVPHDTIKGLAISPVFASDNSIYGIVRADILKSTDRGVTWKRLVQGIDNNKGGDLHSVAINPTTPNILYLSTVADGIFKSEDAGNSWFKFNEGLDTLNIGKLYVPPAADHGVVFAAGGRKLYKKVGRTPKWFKVYTAPALITAINGFGWYPKESSVLVGNINGMVSLSTDGGVNWRTLFDNPGCGAISSIGTSRNPFQRNRFFLGTAKCGIFRTVDGGLSFQEANFGITDLNIRAITLSPVATNPAIFASTWSQAIFVSANAGLTWQKRDDGITTDTSSDQTGDPDFGDISLSPAISSDKTLFLAGYKGLYKSTNLGAHWGEMVTMPRNLIQSVKFSPNYGGGDATLAFTTYAGGIYKSTDDGNTWYGMATDIDDYRNHDIVFSPAYASDKTMFTTINPNIIAKSTDGGATWVIHKFSGLPGPTIIALSPAFVNDHTLFVASRGGDLFKSIDGGASYTTVYKESVSLPCGISCYSSLTVSPNFANDRTLLLASNSGLRISTDGGDTWFLKGTKTTFGYHGKIAISPNFAIDRTVFVGGTDGLFRTLDGFNTWVKVSDPTKGVDGYIEELAISPNFKNDHMLIMTVKGKGLFKSKDLGSTYQAIGVPLIKDNLSFAIWTSFPAVSNSSIQFSPGYAKDKTILGISSERLYRSRDGGETWAVMNVF